MEKLIARLARFDLLDLASGTGAVQLLPSNANHLIRLEFLASLVAHLVPQPANLPSLPLADWHVLLNSPPIADTTLTCLEDPFSYPYTECITFGVGSFVTFPGLPGDTAFTLGHLLRAAYKQPAPELDFSCRRSLMRLGLACLLIGDAVATRAGIGRGVPPAESGDGLCSVPEAQQFTAFKSVLNFTESEIAAIFGKVSRGLRVADIAPLVVEAGASPLPRLLTGDPAGIVATRPILKIASNWVVISPTSLLGAIRHAILTLAVRYGEHAELAFRYRRAVAATTFRSLERMQLRCMGTSSPEDRASPFIEGMFSFDTDKVAHVLVVCDDFDQFGPEVASGAWATDSVIPKIEEAFRTAQVALFKPETGIRYVLHLVVFQSAGRAASFAFDAPPNPDRSRVLLFTAEDVETISLLDNINQMSLWQFAQAREHIRESARVVAFDPLDEFSMYRDRHCSYYFSDDRRPNSIWVTPGYGLGTRLDAQRRWDFHAALSPDLSGIEEVALVNHEREIPIYAPYPPDRECPSELIEGLPLPVWVVSETGKADGSAGPYMSFLLVDAVAYWLWQFAPDLDPILAHMATLLPRLTIRLELLPSTGWDEETGDPDRTLVATAQSAGVVLVAVGAGIVQGVATPDNSGERALMAEVLRGISRLAEGVLGARPIGLEESGILSIVDRYAPLGIKKKLLFLTDNVSLQLIEAGLPDFREIQPFDENRVLDLIGTFVTDRRGFVPGPIPNGVRIELLNLIVGYLYSLLQKEIALLSPDGLLENLVAMNERIVYQQEFRRLTIPTRISCFGSRALRAAALERELSTTAAVGKACRFLIEYMVAAPPEGGVPFSVATYDHLVALANAIIGFANASDALKYRLADRPLDVLPSGRLALGAGPLEVAADAFLAAHAVGEIHRAEDQFGRHWGRASAAGQEDHRELIARMDGACVDEFGYSFRDSAGLLSAIMKLGMGINSEPKRMPWNDFVAELALDLSREKHWIEEALRLFVLESRESFLKPPPGFVVSDIYPWRHNRGLSYLRRPLLLRTRGGRKEVVWGTRHTDQAARYLVDLCFGGKLKSPRSEAMKRLMGYIHNEEGRRFALHVAGLYQGAGRFAVRDHVKKIGGKRLARINGESLGDVDVLVADVATRRLIIVEAKDFVAALTPSELSNEIAELFGGDSRIGTVQVHLQRAEWIADHVVETLKELGLDASEHQTWSIVPLVVIERELMSPFLAKAGIDVISVNQLREQLAGE